MKDEGEVGEEVERIVFLLKVLVDYYLLNNYRDRSGRGISVALVRT